ncbi:type II toxin-antitoxin system PemK/MazF family toxin [Burkholderia vietnamiensis]|uniref:type II toxin-antitoxin system PemK/MazF family toxin n=2 Tax=Burkholderia vietnamiensis TaxID=60552 RepID=UPI002E775D96|nr:type II toxin-antitoxin system PemK/MazF family toxin [Burkholderia vietnamiensis]
MGSWYRTRSSILVSRRVPSSADRTIRPDAEPTGSEEMLNGVPEAGDVIRLYIGPSKGNEQDGYRAVVVITPADINELTGRVVGLPITSSVRGWESEIPISSLARPGVALVDQIVNLSFKAREFQFRGERASDEEMEAIRYAVRMFLDL